MVRGERIPFELAGRWATARDETVQPTHRLEGSRLVADEGDPMFVGRWWKLPFKNLPWTIEAMVGYVNGVRQIVGLHIEATGGISNELVTPRRLEFETGPRDRDPAITADLLRQIPLRQLLQFAVDQEDGGTDPFRTFEAERPPTGWGDDHYRAVADVYRNASPAPLIAIGERWGVSRAAAAKWVARSRELGYLGYPKRPGVAGASAKKTPINPKSKKKTPRRSTK